MNKRKLIKRDAWLAMRNNWGKAFAVVLISFSFLLFIALIEKLPRYLLGISSFADYMQTPGFYPDDAVDLSAANLVILFGTALLYLLIYSPLSLGIKKWYLGIAGADSPPVSAIFDFFTDFQGFIGAFSLHLLLWVKKVLYWLLLNLPALLVFALICSLKYFVDAQVLFLIQLLLSAVFVCLLLLCQLLSLCFFQRYFLAEYIYLLYHCKIGDAFKLSVSVMKGHRSELLSVILSFFPYYLLNLLWLPSFVTLPQMNTVYAIYAKYFIECFERQKNDTASDVTQDTVGDATRQFPILK